MSDWHLNGLTVEWCAGALFVAHDRGAVLLDTPVGASIRLGGRLQRIGGILISSGRASTVGGLVPLLCALERHRGPHLPPLPIHLPHGDERGAGLAGAWQQGWPDRYDIAINVEMPGYPYEVAGFEVTATPVPHVEPEFAHRRVREAPGTALTVRFGDTAVVWIPGATPQVDLKALCRGAQLAVIEVGVEPWPLEGRHRLALDEALRGGRDAQSLWLVGDDGRRIETQEN